MTDTKHIKDGKFVPTEELLNFATDFSKVYKSFSPGNYSSVDGNYKISYVNERHCIKSGFGITSKTGIIEIDKSIILNPDYTDDSIFYFIIWCIIITEEQDIINADRLAIKYYLSTGRDKTNLLSGLSKVFTAKPTALNEMRFDKIFDILNGKDY